MPKSASSVGYRRKIALLITEMQMGGAAKVVRDQASAFRSFSEVREIVFNRADGVDFEGEDIVSLDVGGGGSPFNRLVNFVRRVVRYGRFKREWRPDVSIAHLEGAHYVDLLSRRGEKNVLVLHGSILHNRDITGKLGWLRLHVLMPMAFRRADAIVSVSRDIATEMRSMGFPDVHVINNFFDVERIERLAVEPISSEHFSIFDGPPVIVTTGRFAEQKNQAPLLEAFAKMRTTHRARLLILGDGPLRQNLIDQAHSLGLSVRSPWTVPDPEADVHLPGVQSNPFAFIARSAMFVLPSGWEGFPLALCEAMACGKAVVSADCSTGPREILSPDSHVPTVPIASREAALYGMLMPIPVSGTSTIDEWAVTMAGLLDDPSLRDRLGSAGRKRVAHFTPETIVPQWRDLIDDLFAASVKSRS